jgi:hypothetical protein
MKMQKEEDEMGKAKLTPFVRFCYDSPFYCRCFGLCNVLVAMLGSEHEEFSYMFEVGSACKRLGPYFLECDPGVPRLQSASFVSKHRFMIELLL